MNTNRWERQHVRGISILH